MDSTFEMDVTFPESVIKYLVHHKGDDFDKGTQIDRALKQFVYLKPFLDAFKPKSILDIGCGLSLGTIFAARYINASYLALVDGDGSGELFSDYREGAPAWNNVSVAGDMARANLPDTCVVQTFVQSTELTIPVDMIVSFKSWGTHYPISEYIPLAQRSLIPGGVVLIDLRPGPESFRVEQADEMRAAGFKLVDRFGATDELRRHMFIKRG